MHPQLAQLLHRNLQQVEGSLELQHREDLVCGDQLVEMLVLNQYRLHLQRIQESVVNYLFEHFRHWKSHCPLRDGF